MQQTQPSDTKKGETVVLIVDDEPRVCQALKAMVTSIGYQCLTAKDGGDAIAVLEKHRCDLIISDVVMPHMDGMELLAYVREQCPQTDVIIATGFSEKASYAEVIKAGAIDFIKKPIESAELEAKLARAIREREMVRKLERLSLSDSLTGLLNRRAFDEEFSKEVDRAARQNYSLFLAIVDIDNFKEYNDTYGHQAGDSVLVKLARILRDCTRKNVDLNFRIGGDEFSVLLPQTSCKQATCIVERIRNSFIQAGLGSTSLSIGVVACERDSKIPQGSDEERMKEAADKAMYAAKAQGKNMVVCRA